MNNLEEFNKLQRLLNDFVSAISRIDRNVDKMYKEIEENKRITILQWFSTIPYQSHHDLACEGRVEHTGTWLFKRKEFTCWENSTTPAILWLHGIPGAGKTKLVSATIDYLNANVKFDKIAFFYCKRDEADRRDREKILLSLIKQLACPPAKDTMEPAGHTRICAHALEVYNKEQKDPSSRHQLNFNSCLNLLSGLVECFKHPAVVLDALDECSEEVCSDLLPGLLSLIRNAKCPFKVFISSRHNLVIENHLWDLPHICIEARDNAEDIENYVRQQLTLRIQKKILLQGNVSQSLRNCIEGVILRDAKGMFLWVDLQLRELCKLIRESDIRNRLGRLPKGLTGVYDEIMNSIKSPGCNFSLAKNALQWMLVSKCPLRPRELVVAAQLSPSTSGDSSLLSGESMLAVELLIQSCEGLLLLDTRLDVVRFSHLSVQEYLETNNQIWDISNIDMQLFVSESCLWTLQYSSLNSPLYDYAASYWFKHCRSYQDLVLSAGSFKDTKHKLSIALLDSFLGPFKQASPSYIEWERWVGVSLQNSELDDIVHSTPVCPAFSAAFAGLGELVSWLWNLEGNDTEVRNHRNMSLLLVAIKYGTTWLVAELLKRGCKIDDDQDLLFLAYDRNNLDIMHMLLDHGADINATPKTVFYSCKDGYGTVLYLAAYRGNLEVVTLLLDRGADIYLPCGHYGSALCAAAYIGRREIVTLLLDRGVDVNVYGGNYGTALGAAAYGGDLQIVTLLLDRGADVNLTGGYYGTVLGAAACGGDLEIVTLLLDRGADVNLTGGNYGHGTALDAAAYSSKLEIVILLLDRGADVNLTSGHYGTALGTAAYMGRHEFVTLLLDRGAEVNLTGGYHGTALGAAAYAGELDIVTLLLKRGADVNLPGGYYGTAIGAAARWGHLEIVTLLLERGADVNLPGGNYGSALGVAAYGGESGIVILLLDRGADVNLPGGYYGSALGTAAYRGKLEIVTLLLDRGGDVNLPGGDYGSPLGAAARWGHLEIVTLLLDRGADVNLIGGNYGSALSVAAYSGRLDIATLLLDRGADVNFIGGRYGSALGAAAYMGRREIITLLLEWDADVNLSGGDSGTVLGAAAYSGRLDIVTLLLDRGADVNLTGDKYGTALYAAAHGGHLGIVTLLLDRGADAHITHAPYGTALGAAAYKGHLEIATLLLDRGADVNFSGRVHSTALSAAAFHGNLEVVTLLLERGADVNHRDGNYGTALSAAAYGGKSEIVTFLLDRRAQS
ncbi:ankyrin repeat-containing domain protein [Tirmania nivea]|nr:ankyrin repeat-containing domain protein [Tirmania nivea]